MIKNSDPFFQHFVIVARDIRFDILENTEILKKNLSKILKKANLQIIKDADHKFTPHGYSLVFILSASHLAVHTWPENGFIHLDLITCTHIDNIDILIKLLKKELKTTEVYSNEVLY